LEARHDAVPADRLAVHREVVPSVKVTVPPGPTPPPPDTSAVKVKGVPYGVVSGNEVTTVVVGPVESELSGR
jgi:hypothetical protein